MLANPFQMELKRKPRLVPTGNDHMVGLAGGGRESMEMGGGICVGSPGGR